MAPVTLCMPLFGEYGSNGHAGAASRRAAGEQIKKDLGSFELSEATIARRHRRRKAAAGAVLAWQPKASNWSSFSREASAAYAVGRRPLLVLDCGAPYYLKYQNKARRVCGSLVERRQLGGCGGLLG